MGRVALEFLVAYIVSAVASAIIASLVLTPALGPSLGAALRPPEDTGGALFLAAGFLPMAAASVVLFRVLPGSTALARAGRAGGLVWALVIANYLVVAGWSTISPVPMLWSGVISGMGPFVGALALGVIGRLGARES